MSLDIILTPSGKPPTSMSLCEQYPRFCRKGYRFRSACREPTHPRSIFRKEIQTFQCHASCRADTPLCTKTHHSKKNTLDRAFILTPNVRRSWKYRGIQPHLRREEQMIFCRCSRYTCDRQHIRFRTCLMGSCR